jgi:hypothetical protein
MRRTVLRCRWVVVLVAGLVAAAAAPVGWLVETSSAQVSALPERCDTSICQTAVGPLTLLPAIQRLRFNVHNIDRTEALITMVVIDSRTGEVLAKHQEVLKPFTGASFEPDLGARGLPAIQLVGGVRVSRLRGAQGGGFGGSLELFDIETGRTAHILPLTIGGPRVSNLWGNDKDWSAESDFYTW